MLEHHDPGLEDFSVGYGSLVTRMLFVAHSQPEPTSRWLWLLNLFVNSSSDPPSNRRVIANAVDLVQHDLGRYLTICSRRRFVTGVKWSRKRFEEYVLARLTSIVRKSVDTKDAAGLEVRESDFDPRLLYLNDVAANGTEHLSEILLADIGIDWHTTAVRLSQVYGLAKAKWVFGTRELVLYQKKFLSTVAASVMAYVLIHVTLCNEHWIKSDGKKADGATAADNSDVVGEYERVWMSIGSMLDKFDLYLDLGSVKHFKTLTDIAANPVSDSGEFQRVKNVIRSQIVQVSDGLFGLEPIHVKKDKEKDLVELIALIDNNISAAEKYIKSVQKLLLDVNFKVINNFMKSTHIWLL